MAELTAKERLVLKEREMKEKYADVIFDLATKYEKTIDIGFEMLKAIARANIYGEDPLYESNVVFDLGGLVADEKEYEALAKEAYILR